MTDSDAPRKGFLKSPRRPGSGPEPGSKPQPPKPPSEEPTVRVTVERPSTDRSPFTPPANFSARQPGQADPTRLHEPPRVVPPYQAPPPPAPPSGRAASSLYVPWWGFVLVILVVAAITCGAWGLMLMNRDIGASSGGPTPTPIFMVITATPTLGPPPGSIQTPFGPTEPSVITPTPPATVEALPTGKALIQVGSNVMIEGTEGAGLAVRQGPGTTYSYFFVAQDGDTFRVDDGPREGDGYIWWYIIDPNDPNRAGWAVEDFLFVVP